MDKFLANLYREEMEKQAAADFGQFLDEQPISQLEELLGIRKHAVAEVQGDVEAPLPDSLPGYHLDAKMKLMDQFVAKSRGAETGPTREQASEVGRANFGGPSTLGKEISPHHPSDGKPAHDPTEKKAEMMWADQMGKKLAAAACGMAKHDEFATPEAKDKGKAMAMAMKAGKGKPVDQRKALVSAAATHMQKRAAQGPVEGATVEPESWMSSRRGMMEALSEPEAAADRKSRMLRSGGVGGLVGGALGVGGGLLAAKHLGVSPGLAALLGGVSGGSLGASAGMGHGAGGSNEEQLAQRGIQMTMGGLGRGRFTPEAAKKYLKQKESQGAGDGGGQQMAGQGAGQGITSLGGLGDTGVGTDKTTIAHVKAKIAARALRATEGAPEHIKQAAAVFAGRQIAKLVTG